LKKTRPKKQRSPRRSEDETRGAILAAARTVFMGHGFAAASVSGIAKEAGVSTKTIYRFFDTKTDILVDVIKSFLAVILPGFDRYEAQDAASLESALRLMLRELAEYGLSENGNAANRLALAEIARVPEMVAAYYREGHEKIIDGLARWLDRRRRDGLLKLDDPHMAAAMLLSMAFADLTRDATVSNKPPSGEEIDRWVAGAVKIFLKGAGVPDAGHMTPRKPRAATRR